MRNWMTITMLAAAAAPALAQTVSLSLTSPQNGQTVSPGATINWTIAFTVSTGNNQGLALLSTDLVQDETNPDLFNIPAASGVPAPMSNFSRPAGVSNPGESNPTTGYVGVLRGNPGEQNLIQIGGAQNTFGQARAPGSGMAENANVTAGIGQSGSVTLASGSFTAPSVAGSYTLRAANAVANVLVQRNNPPAISPVTAATVNYVAPTIAFTVGGTPCPGDLDGNGTVDIADLALLLSQFGLSGPGHSADIDHDNDVDIADLALLLSHFGTPC
jgi:hypothetical protein